MITIREGGNTTIRYTTSGVEVAGGEKWTVYPYVDNDPTLEKFDKEKQQRIKELSITGFREKDDYSGTNKLKDIVKAIAQLEDVLKRDIAKDLDLVVGKIAVEPGGEMARILEKEHGIKAITQESQAPSEAKG